MIHIVIHIISYDIWFYISHVLLHNKYLYWIHKGHHANRYPKFLDTYEGHWLESPFQSLGFVAPYILLPFESYTFFVCLLLLNLRGMARHDPRTIWIIGNHHLLHHEHFSYNYGELWIDTLMGTNYKQKEECKRGIIGYLI